MRDIVRFFIIALGLVSFLVSYAQDKGVDGRTVFYHPNGEIASEGIMREGKPDGYWKTYNDKGILVSEGNRKDFILDSIWRFYSDSGFLITEIQYEGGLKNGIRRTYHNNEVLEERFIQDIKQGLSKLYDAEGRLLKTIPYVNGLEEGLAMEYDRDGVVISLTEFKRGYIVSRENINRRDKNGLKQGKWKFFYENGVLQLEGQYINDLRDGYFKEFGPDGKLLSISKYFQGIKQEDAREISKLEVRVDYYPDGKARIIGHYFNGIPEGVRREYDEQGNLVRGFLFQEGVIVGRGITKETGLREGPWKEYYEDGKLRAEGNYSNGVRTGGWKFYFRSGALEQEGRFNQKGRHEGEWKWYYESGKLLRIENYLDGVPDGPMTEFSENEEIIVQGEYLDGLEDGSWMYHFGDHTQTGTYANGKRQGKWTYRYSNGILSFEGSFIEDNPNGKHTWYWENGKRKDEGFYVMGRREGEWTKFDENGLSFLYISYKDGVEKKYDGKKITPEVEEEPIED